MITFMRASASFVGVVRKVLMKIRVMKIERHEKVPRKTDIVYFLYNVKTVPPYSTSTVLYIKYT